MAVGVEARLADELDAHDRDGLTTITLGVGEVRRLLAVLERTREALRAEVRKRFYYRDGSPPDDEWVDAYLAHEYRALAGGADDTTPEAPGHE